MTRATRLNNAVMVMRQTKSEELVAHLLTRILQQGLPTPEREVRFHPTRRWRFDLCWPALKLAVEVDGGTWAQGRHTRGTGYRDDCIKLNEAALLGWRVLRVTSDMVRDDSALAVIDRAMAAEVTR